MRTLTLQPLIPSALWTALTILAAALLILYAWRRPTGLGRIRWSVMVAGMAAALACVLGVLLNPTWIETIAPPGGRPQITILCDASNSMTTPDAGERQSRYAAAARIARELDRQLKDRFLVQLQRFGETAFPADPASIESQVPDGRITNLSGVIESAQQTNTDAERAVVLLSDGIHNAGGGAAAVLNAARAGKALSTPVYTRTFGETSEVRDVQLELRSSQELAFTEQRVAVTALIRNVGFAGRQAVVTLVADGRDLDTKTVTLPASDASSARFTVSRKQRGVYRYQVRVEPFREEATPVNNAATFVLRVIDEPIRILLLEGKPYWDGKFLMRALASDPSVDVDMRARLTRDRAVRRMLYRARPGVSTQPAADAAGTVNRLESSELIFSFADVLEKPERLDAFQVIVLGRDVDPFLTPAGITNLRTWVARKGGSLVCYRGQPTAGEDERIGSLMPVQWGPSSDTRFRVKLTSQGQEMQWLSPVGADALSLLPSLASDRRPREPKALATVLATPQSAGEATPVVTFQPYGMGRVVALEGSGTWRWAFLPPQHEGHQEAYASMWQSLIRWLVSSAGLPPGRNLALSADRVSFGVTDTTSATLLLREEATSHVPSVELYASTPPRGAGHASTTSPADEPRKPMHVIAPTALGEVPGVYRVVFGRLPVGTYEAVVAGSADEPAGRTLFDVHRGGQEDLDLRARPDLMARIAAESGGAVLKEASATEISRLFLDHVERSRPSRVERKTAWDRWWVLAAVFSLWMTVWAMRRASGLT